MSGVQRGRKRITWGQPDMGPTSSQDLSTAHGPFAILIFFKSVDLVGPFDMSM